MGRWYSIALGQHESWTWDDAAHDDEVGGELWSIMLHGVLLVGMSIGR